MTKLITDLKYVYSPMVVIGLCATTLCGQTKETVILYNSIPVEVEIDNTGDIKRFKENKPNYLEGYTIDTKQRVDTDIRDITPVRNSPADLLDDGPISIRFDAGSVDSPTMRSLDLLNAVAARLRSKTGLEAILRAPETDDPVLIEKRNGQLASCKKYLIAQGISVGRITTTLSSKASDQDEVIITFE